MRVHCSTNRGKNLYVPERPLLHLLTHPPPQKQIKKLQINSLIFFFYLYGPTIGGECEGLNFFSQQTTWLAGKETAVLLLKLVLMAASILLPRPDGDDKYEQSESAQDAQINKNNLIAARASINRGRGRPWAGGAPCNCRDAEASSNTLHASATPVILAPEGRPHGVNLG